MRVSLHNDNEIMCGNDYFSGTTKLMRVFLGMTSLHTPLSVKGQMDGNRQDTENKLDDLEVPVH